MMARIKTEFPDDLMQKISTLQGQELDRICEEALESAGKIVLDETRRQLQSVIGSNPQTKRDQENGSRSTGELVSALGLSPVKLNSKGVFNAKVGFREPRQHRTGKGQTNARIASVLEHGRHGQPPRPFMAKAKSKTQKAAINEIRRVVEEGIDKA